MFDRQTEDRQNNLMLMKMGAVNTVSCWAGFALDKAGQFTTPEAWKTYGKEFARGLASPIQVSVLAE